MPPMLIYHRGRHGTLADGTVLAENSLEGFERAIADGAQMIELDVWTDMAVAHDPGSEEVPTLPEVLALVRGRCRLNIEIKSPQTAVEALGYLKDQLALDCWSPDKFVVSAFHHNTALLAARTLPELQIGAIMECVPTTEYVESLHRAGIKNLHLHWTNIYMDIEAGYELREVCNERDMEIWIWTVNDSDVFEVMSDYGVAAVFTDVPDVLAAAGS